MRHNSKILFFMLLAVSLAAVWPGCSGGGNTDGGVTDASGLDSGADGGWDGGSDSGNDSGTTDGATDGGDVADIGNVDGGWDGGHDGG